MAHVDSNLVDPAAYPDSPHIAPNHIESKTGRLLPHQTVDADGVTSAKHLFEPGHVLYSKIRPYLAKAAVVGFSGLCSADMYPVSTGLEPRFLHRWLIAPEFTALTLGKQGRSVLPKINKADLGLLPVPVAPLGEQRRIAATIEEQFSRLDAAEEGLESVARQLVVLRDTIASAAVAGWRAVALETVLREPLRNGHSAKAAQGGSVRTLTLTAVTKRNFSDENTKMTAADPERVRDLWLKSGDILVERANTPELVGTAALYRGPDDWAIFPDLLIRVRLTDAALPEYLEIVLRSLPSRRYFRAAAQGIAGSMPKIDQGAVERLPVPLPSIPEQRRIVAEVEARLSLIDVMFAAIVDSRRRAASLRRSILERAFRGELVPQDPSDEPASVLLERIRAERAAQPKLRRGRRAGFAQSS